MQPLMRTGVALVSGILFGYGLALSGMLNPERVRSFLDVSGNWDPSLGFVLIGAVAVAAVGNLLSRLMSKPVLDDTFHVPDNSGSIDNPLITGSAIFGVGWALSGLCPGPAIASIGRDVSTVYVFALAMIAGILIHSGQESNSNN